MPVLPKNFNFNLEDRHRRTLLHVAIAQGDYDIAASVAPYARPSDFEKVDEFDRTPLFWAIRWGYEEVVRIYFLKRQTHSSVPHRLDTKLLIFAIKFRRESIAMEVLRVRGFRLARNLQHRVLRLAFRKRLNLVGQELQRVIIYNLLVYSFCRLISQIDKLWAIDSDLA